MMVIRDDGMHDVNDLPLEEQMEARKSLQEFMNKALGNEEEVKAEVHKTLELNSKWSGTVNVSLEINTYVNNNCLYIGLVTGENMAWHGDLTINLAGKCPDYCGYVDINNMPELEEFIEKHELGEFTGLMGKSGFCTYPLYLFNVDKLREYCPDGMEMYERSIGKVQEKEEVKKEEVRK